MDRSAIDARCIDTTDRVGETTGFRGFRKEHIMPDLVCQRIKRARRQSLMKPDRSRRNEVGPADRNKQFAPSVASSGAGYHAIQVSGRGPLPSQSGRVASSNRPFRNPPASKLSLRVIAVACSISDRRAVEQPSLARSELCFAGTMPRGEGPDYLIEESRW